MSKIIKPYNPSQSAFAPYKTAEDIDILNRVAKNIAFNTKRRPHTYQRKVIDVKLSVRADDAKDYILMQVRSYLANPFAE